MSYEKYNTLYKDFDNKQYKNPEDIRKAIILNDLIKENIYFTRKNILKNSSVTQNNIDLYNQYIALLSYTLKTEIDLEKHLDIDYYNTHVVEQICCIIESEHESNNSKIAYELSSKLANNENRILFQKLKSIYINDSSKMDSYTKMLVRSVLISNHLKFRPTKPDADYHKEILFFLGSPEEHLIGGYLRDNVFNNYVISYLHSNQFDLCLNFINSNNKYLKRENKLNIMNFNYSKYFLFVKKYRISAEYALKCNKADWWIYCNSLITLIICYYELGAREPLKKLIIKFKKVLSKKSIFEDEKEYYYNFLNAVNFLSNFQKHNCVIDEFLKERVQNSKIINKKWLKEKIDEIKKAT